MTEEQRQRHAAEMEQIRAAINESLAHTHNLNARTELTSWQTRVLPIATIIGFISAVAAVSRFF